MPDLQAIEDLLDSPAEDRMLKKNIFSYPIDDIWKIMLPLSNESVNAKILV